VDLRNNKLKINTTLINNSMKANNFIFIFILQIAIAHIGNSQNKSIEYSINDSQFEEGQNLVTNSENINFYLTVKNNKVSKITGYNLKTLKSINVSFKATDFVDVSLPASNGNTAKTNNGSGTTKKSAKKISKPMCIVCETYPCAEGGSTGGQSVNFCVRNCELKPCTNSQR